MSDYTGSDVCGLLPELQTVLGEGRSVPGAKPDLVASVRSEGIGGVSVGTCLLRDDITGDLVQVQLSDYFDATRRAGQVFGPVAGLEAAGWTATVEPTPLGELTVTDHQYGWLVNDRWAAEYRTGDSSGLPTEQLIDRIDDSMISQALAALMEAALTIGN